MISLALLGAMFGATDAVANNDAQLWLNGGLRYRPVKKVSLTFDQQIRRDQNLTKTDSIISDLAGAWRLQKWLRLGLGYRLEWERTKKDELERVQRLHLQARLKHRVGPLALALRLRLQEKYERDGEDIESTQTFRPRLSLAVPGWQGLEPTLSGETFHRLGVSGNDGWRKIRLTVGTSLPGTKTHRYSVFYRSQIPLADPDDPVEHILGLGYQYRVRRRKAK